MLAGAPPDADRAVLIEGRDNVAKSRHGFKVRSYVGVRTARYAYFEYRRANYDADRRRDRRADRSRADARARALRPRPRPGPAPQPAPVTAATRRPRRELAGLLGRLENCEGPECVVSAPVSPPRAMSRARLEIALLAVALLALTPLVAGDGEDASGAVRKPNIVLITTDDQTLASLRVMDRVQRELVDRGVTFENALATFPLCCPSRASWITGQYAHNHGVIDNQERNGGGYQALREPDKVLPAWLDAGGYDTALVGKWLHDYRTLDPAPGWDRFWALTAPTMVNYYGYEVTDSRGGRVRYGKDADDYVTDALTRDYALPYIRQHERDPDPFFLHVSYIAPHWGRGRNDAAGRRCANGKPFAFETAKAKPAPRDAGAFGEAKLPTPPSFNEADMSDKPGAVRGRERLSRREIRVVTERYRCELASLLAVDRAVGEIDGRARRGAPESPHLRDLHLRQRLHARRAPDPGREGAALRGGAQGAAGDRAARRSRPGSRSTIRSPTSTWHRRSSSSPRSRCPTRSSDPSTAARSRPTPTGAATPTARSRSRPSAPRGARPPAPSSPPPGSGCAPPATPTSSTTGPRSRPWPRASASQIGAGSVTDVELYDLAADPHELHQPPRRFRLRRHPGGARRGGRRAAALRGGGLPVRPQRPATSLRAAAEGSSPAERRRYRG